MTSFAFGIDTLLADQLAMLDGKRVGLVAHPASITSTGEHSIDALLTRGVDVVRAFGPQHGMRGDKQDNMIESTDYVDPRHQIPIISLYGTHRYPEPSMLEDLDIVLFDLQDIGCRVYTYITTLRYFIDVCAQNDIPLVVLDRPNPIGRPIDGLFLVDGEQSFVGCDVIPMRHGLTIAELGTWFADRISAPPPQVIAMHDYDPQSPPGYGWPLGITPWVNPSPNASSLNMTRCFPGTVLLEGTTLSEGRGTTNALEVIGAPDFPVDELLRLVSAENNVRVRPCFFSPTFHKHEHQLCQGIQLHTDFTEYQHENFKPFRLVANILKHLRQLRPDYDIWRYHEYEYEQDRIPIDVINGGPFLRQWVDDDQRAFSELDDLLTTMASEWEISRQPYLLY